MSHPQPRRIEKCDHRRSKRWAITLIGLMICSTVFYRSWPVMGRAVGDWLNIGRPLTEPVDHVFVLGGGAHLRPLVAAEIYKAGYAPHILVASPELLPDSLPDSLTEADLISRMLQSEGIPESVMQRLPLPEISTRGEIRALKDFLQDQPSRCIAIVTDHYHTRRVRLLTRRMLPAEQAANLVFVSCPTDEYGPENWWKYESGLRTYWLELIKLLAAAVGA